MLYDLAIEQGKIADFMDFPMFGLHTKYKDKTQKNNFEDYLQKDLKASFSEMEEALAPYINEIEKYYFRSYSIVQVFKKLRSIFDYESIEDYLDSFKSFSDEELRVAIIGLLMNGEEELPYDEEMMDKINLIIKNQSYMPFVDTVSDDGHEKWHLMQIMLTPKKSVDQWLLLLEDLKEVYEKFRIIYEADAISYGKELVTKLNDSKGEYLNELTNGFMQPDLFQGKIICSWVGALTIAIVFSENENYVSIGYKVEEFFKSMKMMKENETIERVTALKNLGDKTRYKVLKCIAEGTQSTKAIAESVGVSSATISYHLSNLVTSHLVVHENVNGKLKVVINSVWIEKLFSDIQNDLIKAKE